MILFLAPAFIFLTLRIFFSTPLGSVSFLNPLKSIVIEKTSPISQYLNEDLLVQPGSYGVAVENLKTGETYFFNKDRQFDSASLYKLWVMAIVEKGLENGSLDPEEELSAPKKDLDKKLGTQEESPSPEASAEESSEPSPSENDEEESPSPSPEPEEMVTIKLSDALKQMITYSDNYSALLLVKKVGEKNITNFLRSNGFSNSAFSSPPKTTAFDIYTFYKKLYAKEFVGSDKMIALLKRQQINDRIPKYLEDNIEVAHKTGELYGNKHDAGIVFGKDNYIIVVLTDTQNPAIAANNTAEFSKKVFDYFN